MANHTTNYFKLGLFVTIGLILFTVAVYYIGDKQNMFGDSIAISARFRNVNGLQKGNNVRYSGINVGTVSMITIVDDSTVQVDMLIEASAGKHIRKDAVTTISSDGLVGNMMVSIIPTENALPHVSSGDVIDSYSRIDASDMLNTLNVTNENAAILTADLLKITQSILEKEGTFGVLLYDSVLAQDLQLTMQNLKMSSNYIMQASKNLNTTINTLDDPNGLFYKLSQDSLLPNSIDVAVNSLKESGDQISMASKQLNDVMKELFEFEM